MNCPPEIAKLILQILYRGIIAARSYGWGDDGQGAAIEANHIHNLPGLLSNYKQELLAFYWNIERTQYMGERLERGNAKTGFEDLWRQLQLADSTLRSDAAVTEKDAEAGD